MIKLQNIVVIIIINIYIPSTYHIRIQIMARNNIFIGNCNSLANLHCMRRSFEKGFWNSQHPVVIISVRLEWDIKSFDDDNHHYYVLVYVVPRPYLMYVCVFLLWFMFCVHKNERSGQTSSCFKSKKKHKQKDPR